MLKDKDYDAISSMISEVALEVYTITPDNPRALSAVEYAKIYREKGVNATPCNSFAEATSLGRSAAVRNGTALLCLGSLYTYAELIRIIK